MSNNRLAEKMQNDLSCFGNLPVVLIALMNKLCLDLLDGSSNYMEKEN